MHNDQDQQRNPLQGTTPSGPGGPTDSRATAARLTGSDPGNQLHALITGTRFAMDAQRSKRRERGMPHMPQILQFQNPQPLPTLLPTTAEPVSGFAAAIGSSAVGTPSSVATVEVAHMPQIDWNFPVRNQIGVINQLGQFHWARANQQAAHMHDSPHPMQVEEQVSERPPAEVHPISTPPLSFRNEYPPVEIPARYSMTRAAQALGLGTDEDRLDGSPSRGSAVGAGAAGSATGAASSATDAASSFAGAAPEVHFYEGNESTCSICLSEFRHNEMVTRMQCGHVFHGQCWYDNMTSGNAARTPAGNPACPNCRGTGLCIAVWKYIDTAQLTQTISAGNVSFTAPNLHRGEPGESMELELASILRDHLSQQLQNVDQHLNRRRPDSATHSRPPSRDAVERLNRSFQRYDMSPSRDQSEDRVTWVVTPNTDNDAADWAATSHGNWMPTPSSSSHDHQSSLHTETRLKDGRPVVVLDIGSVGSLGGDEWVTSMASAAASHGRKDMVKQVKRDRPLNVSGVGSGSQQAKYNCVLPLALKRMNGTYSKGTLEIPTINRSQIPGLLGLLPLRERRAIIDCEKMQVHFAGPGDYDLEATLPPGTESFQGELTPSGHFGLPCAEYEGLDQAEKHGTLHVGEDLALHTEIKKNAQSSTA